jgi:cell division protein FtsL
MTQEPDKKDRETTKDVSIAGGSLLLIALIVWFFTDDVKSEVRRLRYEVTELQSTVQKQDDDLNKIRALVEELKGPRVRPGDQ